MGRYRKVGYRKQVNGWRVAGSVLHVLLGIAYFAGMVWHLFLRNEYVPVNGEMQWIPFARLAELIEPAVLGTGAWQPVIRYVAARVLVYVPFGYFTALLFYRRLWFFRFPVLLLGPVAVEVLQWQLELGKTDIDDVIFGIVGGLLGAMIYSLFAACFGRHRVKEE